ncbi:MAG: histidinol-phosphatase HisJ family protein [Saccharofermentans sp.]|nr:histidinol-phosphatase HisJ family protein [Saccharofermentans sp.]
MFTDSHNHTNHYSPDATQSAFELIDACKAAGIPRVAITEHYELDYPHKEDPLYLLFDINDYVAKFPSWKSYSAEVGGPELLMGIEFGGQTHITASINNIAAAHPFDIVLLSNHLFRNEDIYFSQNCYKIPLALRHKEYIDELVEMADKCTNYDVIAHYDYVNRYSSETNSAVLLEHCQKSFENLFEILISRDKALEINTRSIDKQIKKGSDLIMPDPAIIKKYVDMGGKLITLGSDSHTTETLGIHFAETAAYLKSLGINEICTYKNRQVVLETI